MATTRVQSVTRAFSILNAFDKQRTTLTSTEIAARVGLNNKTVHRFLLTLEAVGAVSRMGRGRFCLGMTLAELGNQVAIHRVLNEISQPYLEHMAKLYNESVQVAVLDGTNIISIAHIPSTHSLTIGIREGKHWPAYCTAIGKVLLADMDDTTLKTFLADCKYEKRTVNTITNATDFMAHISDVRAQGFAINDQESDLGMRGIAIPIKNKNGHACAAMSLSGPTMRLGMEKLHSLRSDLQYCVDGISENLYG
ncbi:MAG: IclR family transcriptional regulator [Gammaproteobacteria bacterium]|nr:IclR family transcriptional regulator [Gammaproteobacteria bacterium]